ncbi:hypothetical protein [Ostreiculturibacter nitratireducens]|uniref:hypothetical protein n=1 Tax=Ostreiculturibacter nitratireducens TaxID=3075226 RepID=UPI0031B61218
MIRVLALTFMFIAGAAFAETPAPDPERGEAYFGIACSFCHRTASLVRPLIQGETPEEKTAWLDAWLVNHSAPDREARAAIIAYLLKEE